jgi:acyl-[acyl-carrier-protein] desaturase
MAHEEQHELIAAVEPTVERLMADHRERRKDWYFHEYVPWEQGRNYVDEPWQESDSTVRPEVRTALLVNLLTEDNLPYYHMAIAERLPEDSVYSRWNHLWTAEEGQHAIALRSYLLTSRNCDPHLLEDDRMTTMEAGYESPYADPVALFVYTSAQELATRVSHRNAGKLTDDEVAYKIMSRIATDENHHFLFYTEATRAMLDAAPSVVLEPIFRVMSTFEMPGTGIPSFARRALEMARIGIYNLRIHHDRIVEPLLRDWDIAGLTDLTPEARRYQEMILDLPGQLLRKAEVFERRYGAATA